MPNGCTGIPWKTPYEGCCDQHDLAYEQGGKVEADWVLRQCIRAAGYPVQAWLIWGVLSTVGWLYWWWLKARGLV